MPYTKLSKDNACTNFTNSLLFDRTRDQILISQTQSDRKCFYRAKFTIKIKPVSVTTNTVIKQSLQKKNKQNKNNKNEK